MKARFAYHACARTAALARETASRSAVLKPSSAAAGREAMTATTDLLSQRLTALAAEFPGYEFATQQTWGGVSIVARRYGGCVRPGLYAVVTADLDEMRRALLEHERPSYQGDSRHQP